MLTLLIIPLKAPLFLRIYVSPILSHWGSEPCASAIEPPYPLIANATGGYPISWFSAKIYTMGCPGDFDVITYSPVSALVDFGVWFLPVVVILGFIAKLKLHK